MDLDGNMDFDFIRISAKLLQLSVHMIILGLYRFGSHGYFLGIGGSTYSPGTEMFASGIIVGFLIYHIVFVCMLFCAPKLKASKVDPMMNLTSSVLFTVTGILALANWCREENGLSQSVRRNGIALGALCLVEGILSLMETCLGSIQFFVDALENPYVASSTGESC